VPPPEPTPSPIPKLLPTPILPDDCHEIDWDSDFDDLLDDLHLDGTTPGAHWHADFGFVRGSEFKLKTEEGKTVTSIDGKNSYYLIVDRATRYAFVYLSDSKEPSIEAVRLVLRKFGAVNTTHRTFRTDRDNGLNKSDLF